MSNSKALENRKSRRETFRIPVFLELSTPSNLITNKAFGYTHNISDHGLGVHTSSYINLDINTEIILHLDSNDGLKTIKLPTKVVWQNESYYGLEFIRSNEALNSILKATFPKDNQQNNEINKFFLYINDEDVNTERNEYFPYADKYITNYSQIREYISLLKQDKAPADASAYFYARYPVGDSNLNNLAIESAHKAFQEFRKFSIQRRRKIMDDIRENLINEKEKIIQLMIIEGHPRKLAEWEYSGMLTAHLNESLDYYQSELIKTVGKFGNEILISVRRPEGVICVSPPKNAACSNSLTASFALMAGNTLIIKPPLNAPISTIYLWRNIVGKALKDNGAPKGTINIVIGNSSKFLDDWCISPHVKGVLLFNDSEKGLEIGKKIYDRGKKPILELSGNDYLLVWKDANIQEAANSLLDCFMGSTQICMVPKKALIHEEIYAEFMAAFIQKVNRLKIGLPSDPETILSPVVKIREYLEYLDDAIKNGATILTGGCRVNHLGELSDSGPYIQPTVVEVPIERANFLKCMINENFFPLLPVIKVSGGGISTDEKDRIIFDRMINLLESNRYGLRISVWVQNKTFIKNFIDNCHQSGLLRINSQHIGFSKCLSTHGGVGLTGGPFGEMNYIWQKTSHLQGISITQEEFDSN